MSRLRRLCRRVCQDYDEEAVHERIGSFVCRGIQADRWKCRLCWMTIVLVRPPDAQR